MSASSPSHRSSSAWGQGLIVFAGVLMITLGFSQALLGLAGVVKNEFYVAASGYILEFDSTVWGWIHLLIGAFVLIAGVAVLTGQTWGELVALALACVSLVASFAFIPFYPFGSIALIALNVFVIWALTTQGRLAQD